MDEKVIVQVVCASDGLTWTPHDGRYVVNWNPHTVFGLLALTSTDDPRHARQFDNARAALDEWNTVSKIQPVRPDGHANKPLTGVSVVVIKVGGPFDPR